MTSPSRLRIALGALVVFAACPPAHTDGDGSGITAERHDFFPIAEGTNHAYGRTLREGTMACESCHYPQSNTFADFTCISCHEHEKTTTDRLHLGLTTYSYTTTSCFACHRTGETGPFDHAGITGECAACHQEGAQFAALPVPGFTHPAIITDCGGCHTTASWKDASSAPTNSSDPAHNVTVTAQIPSYAGTAIASLTQQVQTLPMVMNHTSADVPAALMSDCAACHPDAVLGQYFPGDVHRVLTAAPGACTSCHASAAPEGFVGPASLTPRSPPSPEMKHDAVAWAASAPTTTKLVTEDCVVCHQSPFGTVGATWANGLGGSPTATYHPSLTAKGKAQPTSCLDCHANSRPTSLLTSPGAPLPQGVSYDHQDPDALGDCVPCHSSGGATQWTSWTKGRHHLTGSNNPASCLPCHAGERPTSTTGWKDSNYTRSPFDYVGTTGFSHGNGLDCVVCHPGPGTGGAWGAAQNWTGGTYNHVTAKPTACLPCHVTQRPTTVVEGFSHATNGTGECMGCHRETVKNGKYVDLSDWSGGQQYPADSLIAAPGQFVSVASIKLTRGANNLVTGMTSSAVMLNNAMLHTSSALPAELNAGLSPDYGTDQGKCWHCHTNTNGTVTAFQDGWLHKAFSEFRATPGGTIAAKAQPATCLDCHDTMTPPNIVEEGNSTLQPMDHSAAFTAPVTIGGATVTRVDELECSVCHAAPDTLPGVSWVGGQFHRKIGSATPADCVTCHYPLMADAAKADVTSSPATRYAMKHRSTRVTIQACQTCHPQALGKSDDLVVPTVAQWQPGVLHDAVPTQPTACNDCHTVSKPAARTQSTETYTFAKGGTTSNGAQWMSHDATTVVGKDCVVCHAADATSSSWSKTLSFHGTVTTGVTACNVCHGGGTPGSNNNLPQGLTDSDTITTSSAAAANTHDQMDHSDINASAKECNFCHTQVGSAASAPVQGKEWAQATFHKNFSASNPLVTNGTTGRCSHCHMNVKPGSSYAAFDHAAYTNANTTQDCATCHIWPGTSAATPNWKGAVGAHAASGSTASSTLDCNTCHGQSGSSSVRLTVAASAHYGGVSNGNKCTTCHINFAGFKGTVANLKYAHTNRTANGGSGCGNCHAFKSQVYTTLTNTPPLTYPITSGGHTFSQTRSVTSQYTVDGDNETVTLVHTNPDASACGSCHTYTTTSSGTNIWYFLHEPRNNPGISENFNRRSTNGCTFCH